MTKVPIDTFKAKPGKMHAYLFQNPHIGLAPTLFYSITIPLEPFEFSSDFEWEEQPVHTEFIFDFVQLPVKDWRDLDGKSFELTQDDSDGSIYLYAHNPVTIRWIKFTRLGKTTLRIDCELVCNFVFEMEFDGAVVELTTEVEFEGLVIERDIVEDDHIEIDGMRKAIGNLTSLDAYQAEPQISAHHVRLLPLDH